MNEKLSRNSTEYAKDRKDALQKIGEQIRTHRDTLTTDLVRLEEEFKHEAKWLNVLDMQFPNSDVRVYGHTHANERHDVLPYPSSRFNRFPYLGENMIVLNHTRRIRVAAQAASEQLEEAKSSSERTDHLTSSDLDALEEIPNRLAQMLHIISDAHTFFIDGRREIIKQSQDKTNDTTQWVGPGSEAYITSLQNQASTFHDVQEQLEAMEDACNEISDNTVDLVISLANIYIENIEKWSEIINDCISIAGGPGTWSTYASMLNKSISDHMKKQPEEFKSAVEKLGNVVIAEGIVDKCKNIRMDYWPHPTAEALSQ